MTWLLMLAAAAVTAVAGRVCYRWGYTVRDTEAVRAARQAAQAQGPTYPAAPAAASWTAPTMAESSQAAVEAVTMILGLGEYTPPIGHEDLPGQIRDRLYHRLPPQVVDGDVVLHKPGRHSAEWVGGTALQRALTAGTAEFAVVPTVEPRLAVLEELTEPVADPKQWQYPRQYKELERV